MEYLPFALTFLNAAEALPFFSVAVIDLTVFVPFLSVNFTLPVPARPKRPLTVAVPVATSFLALYAAFVVVALLSLATAIVAGAGVAFCSGVEVATLVHCPKAPPSGKNTGASAVSKASKPCRVTAPAGGPEGAPRFFRFRVKVPALVGRTIVLPDRGAVVGLTP